MTSSKCLVSFGLNNVKLNSPMAFFKRLVSLVEIIAKIGENFLVL